MRNSEASRQTRIRIANIAARLIAVDGISDFTQAKRKAAREAGVTSTRNLPSNDEIECALNAHLKLYQADELAARLRHLRVCALEMMRTLSQFDPYLSGPVLEGNAGRYAAIELHLFTDSAKDIGLFLENSNLEYRIRDRRIQRGKMVDTMCLYAVRTETAEFEISVFAQRDLKASLRATHGGRPFRRAGPEFVEAMLAEVQRDLE